MIEKCSYVCVHLSLLTIEWTDKNPNLLPKDKGKKNGGATKRDERQS